MKIQLGQRFHQLVLPLLAITLCTAIFIWPIFRGIGSVGLNDWDQFQAFYYPVRESFLAHQFPWWNPYLAGGTPLFANPQVGVFSIQTPFILIFGVVAGLKYAAGLYYLLGAFGMYALIKRLGSPTLRAALLSLVWTFSSFTAFHFHVGHYTFLTYLLVPWLFYFLLRINDNFWFSVGLGLSVALFINTAVHNIVIQTLVFLVVACPFVWWVGERKIKTLGAYGLALIIAAALALPKLILSYQYTSQFSRISEPAVQLPIPWSAAWKALTAAGQTVSDTSLIQNVGWWEVSAFIGSMTILAALVGAIVSLSQRRFTPLFLLLLAAVAFNVALGGFLYQGLLGLPVFDLMRVPSRWLGWVIFLVVVAIGASKYKWRSLEAAICLGLLLTLGQEFTFIRPQLDTVFTGSPPAVTRAASFEQYDRYPTTDGGYTGGYLAELAGYGEIRGYDPILGYDWLNRPTARCGINHGCSFLSANAKLTYWSPNLIKLERLAAGPITINMNPSSYLWVNGVQTYPKSKVADLLGSVVITDPAEMITLEFRPW